MIPLKVVLIGASETGKTCLLNRYTDDFYTETCSTIGVDFKDKILNGLAGADYKLTVWDTAGLERFRTLTSSYYRGASVVVLAYDPYSKENDLDSWLSEIKNFADPKASIIIVSTKSDLQYVVSTKSDFQYEIQTKPEDITAAIERLEMTSRVHGSIISTSARIGTGIDRLFSTIVSVCVEKESKKLDRYKESSIHSIPITNNHEYWHERYEALEKKHDGLATEVEGLREEIRVLRNMLQPLSETKAHKQPLAKAEKATSSQSPAINSSWWANSMSWLQSAEPVKQSGCFVHMLPIFPEDTEPYKGNYIAFRGEEGLKAVFIGDVVTSYDLNNSDPLHNKINLMCVGHKIWLMDDEIDSLVESCRITLGSS